MADAETPQPETVEATVLRATPKQLKVRLERAAAEELTIRTDVPDDVRGELEGRRLAVVVTQSRGKLRAELADGFEAAGTVPPTGPEETKTREETGEAAAPAKPKRGRRGGAASAKDAGTGAADALDPTAAGAAASPAATAADAPGAPAVTDESAAPAPSPAAAAAPEPDEKPAARRRSRGRRGKGGASAAPTVDDTTVPDGLREAVEALRAARVKTPA